MDGRCLDNKNLSLIYCCMHIYIGMILIILFGIGENVFFTLQNPNIQIVIGANFVIVLRNRQGFTKSAEFIRPNLHTFLFPNVLVLL